MKFGNGWCTMPHKGYLMVLILLMNFLIELPVQSVVHNREASINPVQLTLWTSGVTSEATRVHHFLVFNVLLTSQIVCFQWYLKYPTIKFFWAYWDHNINAFFLNGVELVIYFNLRFSRESKDKITQSINKYLLKLSEWLILYQVNICV